MTEPVVLRFAFDSTGLRHYEHAVTEMLNGAARIANVRYTLPELDHSPFDAEVWVHEDDDLTDLPAFPPTNYYMRISFGTGEDEDFCSVQFRTTDAVHEQSGVVHGKYLERFIAEFFSAFAPDSTQPSDSVAWLFAAEVLLGSIERLTYDNTRLERELTAALKDLREARALVAQLEQAKELLWQERYGKEHPRRETILAIGLILATLLGPVAGIVTDRALAKQVDHTLEQTNKCISDCGSTNIVGPVTVNFSD